MKTTVENIYQQKKSRQKITVLTAYDFPTARILDESSIDIILVGDSVGMVLLGYDSTLPVTMRDMLHHTKAVSRAVHRSLIVSDLPFGSYETPKKALQNARRFLKEAGADAVKLEGGKKVEKQIRALIQAEIPVMGHLGMLPQSVEATGGYRVQGKEKRAADKILKEAMLLDRLGVFAIVLECIPSKLAERITKKVKCPTIGIGAGSKTDGQVLVLQDILGYASKIKPRFVRKYASLDQQIRKAVKNYRNDVLKKRFPLKKESY